MRDDFCGLYILDDDGNPKREYDLLAWGRWCGQFERHVAYTDVGGRYRVSTIFLGLDHNFSMHHDSLPRLWETMIFETRLTTWERIEIPADEPWKAPHVLKERRYHQSVGDQSRYTSKEEALKGHARAVAIAERWCQEQDAKTSSERRGKVERDHE